MARFDDSLLAIGRLANYEVALIFEHLFEIEPNQRLVLHDDYPVRCHSCPPAASDR